jgi:hypothetical protein
MEESRRLYDLFFGPRFFTTFPQASIHFCAVEARTAAFVGFVFLVLTSPLPQASILFSFFCVMRHFK